MLVSEEDYLAHHGVKGMKWGVRKEQPRSNGTRRRKKKKVPLSQRYRDARGKLVQRRVEKDAKAAKNREEIAKITHIKDRKAALTTHDPTVLAKNMHLLTDEELQSRINRLNMERQVNSMIPKQKSKGKGAVDTALKVLNNDVVKTAAKAAVGKYAGKDTGDALKKSIEDLNERLKKTEDVAEKATKAAEEEAKKRKAAEQAAQSWYKKSGATGIS